MTNPITPGKALERIFEVIREEAASNPKFAHLMDARRGRGYMRPKKT